MTPRDAVFEPLLGKGRSTRQALELLVERWTAAPLADPDLGALEQSLQHLFRRARIRRELPGSAKPESLARGLVVALREGKGTEAVTALGLPLTSPAPPRGRAPRPTGR